MLLPELHADYRWSSLHVALETTASLIAFLAAFLVVGRLRRRTLVCFAVALVPSVDPATGAAVRSKPATKHLNGFEIPILVDLGTGEIFHLEKTPIWGVQFYGGFRKLAGRILGPGRHHRG